MFVKLDKLKAFFEYQFALILLLDCNVIWGHLSNTPSWWGYFLIFLMLFSSFGIFLCSDNLNRRSVIKAIKISLFVVVYLSFFIIFQKINRFSTFKVLVSSVIIIFTFIGLYEKNNPTILFKYRNIVVFCSLFSTIFWVFCSLLNVIPFSGSVYSSWTGVDNYSIVKTFHNIYYETQTSNFSGLINFFSRNSAIFVEAPMAALNFCIALGINKLIDKNNKRFQKISSLILVIGIVSTISMTGCIFVIMIYGITFIMRKSENKLERTIKYMVSFFLLILGIAVIQFLINQKLSVNSGKLRLDDYVATFRTWLHYPLIGVGIDNVEAIYPYMASWRWNSKLLGLSNSLGTVLAEGGIYLLAIYIYPFVNSIHKYFKYKEKNYFLFSLLILYLLINIIFPYNYILFGILVWLIQ